MDVPHICVNHFSIPWFFDGHFSMDIIPNIRFCKHVAKYNPSSNQSFAGSWGGYNINMINPPTNQPVKYRFCKLLNTFQLQTCFLWLKDFNYGSKQLRFRQITLQTKLLNVLQSKNDFIPSFILNLGWHYFCTNW